MTASRLQLWADMVLVVHVAVVVFVVSGLVLVVIGNLRHWQWVNSAALRVAHLLAIAVVVAEAWLGIDCPLTTLEASLRSAAGASVQRRGFVEHWLHQLLYFDAPAWLFVLLYSVFGGLVVAAWRAFPPVWPRRRRSHSPPGARPSTHTPGPPATGRLDSRPGRIESQRGNVPGP
jgi:hypothetical protein